jgi:diketogulonate reductase-like aldo/keto reductase
MYNDTMVGYKTLNKTGEKITEIGIGTWNIGKDSDSGEAAIKAAIESGINFIDTAEMYATEWIVANAIKKQKGLFIATKVSPGHFTYNDLINSCERSLTNLGLNTIDLYQLHWPNRSIPIKETMGAMEFLADKGKIKHIGVSNFTVEELIEAQKVMNKHEIVSNQVEYSVLVRNIENGLYDFCIDNNITIIAYSPLGGGALYSPKYKDTLQLLEQIGKEHHKTATQVALNWLISKKNVIAIPKSANKDHVIEFAGASGWKLTKSEIDEINSVKERKRPIGGLFHPILKRTSGLWSNAMQSSNEKKSMAQRNIKTTKSSKK